MATWLNGHSEHERLLDNIPLEKTLQNRELFLQYVDALGALQRWSEIKQLLNSERFPLDPVTQEMYLARCCAQLDEQAAAGSHWQRALAAAGDDTEKLLAVGSYAEKNNILDIAGAAYNSATGVMPKMRLAQQGRLRVAQAQRDTKKIHAILADMIKIWPNDTAIQNDEAYLRLLLAGEGKAENLKTEILKSKEESNRELVAIEKLASDLVKREPSSLPHHTLLALALLKQHRPVAALDVYSNINVTQNALSPSALAVHAAGTRRKRSSQRCAQ